MSSNKPLTSSECPYDKKEPYDPASEPGKDGFVFLNEGIGEAIRLRNRRIRARDAEAYFREHQEDY
jgi:hypothetical protein